MKSIATLIRLKQWAVDEKRRALADLHGLRDEMTARAAALEAEIAAEQAGADQAVVQFSYAAYVRRAIGQREALAGSIASLDGRIEAAQAELAELFGELKRVERVAELGRLKAAAEQRRLETAVLDEVAARRPGPRDEAAEPAEGYASTA